jgi:hypothetical protein
MGVCVQRPFQLIPSAMRVVGVDKLDRAPLIMVAIHTHVDDQAINEFEHTKVM